MKTTPSSRTKIRFGDNDTLAALVTNSGRGRLPIILTDQQGRSTDDPRAILRRADSKRTVR